MKIKRDIAIDRLLTWAYQVERVDQAGKGRVGPRGYVDSVRVVEAMSLAGAGGSAQADCHPDAEIIHSHVLKLGEPMTGLMIEHGRSGLVPDACVGAVIERRVALNAKGKPVRLYDGSGHVIGEKMIDVLVYADGRVDYGAAHEILYFKREIYSIWYDGLVLLQASLEGQIDDWSPKSPSVKDQPWSIVGVDNAKII